MPRQSKKEPTYLTKQEVEAFFRVIRSPRDKAFFRVMYHHALRASEVGKLMFSDYRPGPAKSRIRITRLKGSTTGVEHALVDAAAAALKAWVRIRGTRPGPLFASRKHTPLSRSQVGRLMKRYSILAGIPLDKAHPRALKHSCVTHLVTILHGDILGIQDHVGHADVRSTMRYIRTVDREVRADLLADWGKR
jgi:integrase